MNERYVTNRQTDKYHKMHIFAREMYSNIYVASAWIILVFIWCKSIYISWTYARKTIFYFFLSETM